MKLYREVKSGNRLPKEGVGYTDPIFIIENVGGNLIKQSAHYDDLLRNWDILGMDTPKGIDVDYWLEEFDVSEKDVEKAIRETLVIENPQSIGIAVEKIMRVIRADK
jgi:hypothetical protein